MVRKLGIAVAVVSMAAVFTLRANAQQPPANTGSQGQGEAIRQDMQSLRQQAEQLRTQLQQLDAQAKPIREQLRTIREKIKADREKLRGMHEEEKDHRQDMRQQHHQGATTTNPAPASVQQ